MIPSRDRTGVVVMALMMSACVVGEVDSAEYGVPFSEDDEVIIDDLDEGEQAPHWCDAQWRFGGRIINGGEKLAIRAHFASHDLCREAEEGLDGFLHRVLVVSAECKGAGGSYVPATDEIRIREDLLADPDRAVWVLLHEWGHKLHRTGDREKKEEIANTYRDQCLRDPGWTMEKQKGIGSWGGGEEDPPDEDPPPQDEGEGEGDMCNDDRCFTLCVINGFYSGSCQEFECWCKDYMD